MSTPVLTVTATAAFPPPGAALTALTFAREWIKGNGGGFGSPGSPGGLHLQRVCIRVLMLRVAEMEGLLADAEFNRKYEACLKEEGVLEAPLDEAQQQRVFEIVSKVAADAVRVVGKIFPVSRYHCIFSDGSALRSAAPACVCAAAFYSSSQSLS